MSEDVSAGRGRLALPHARIGVIMPSSNRLMEPQFNHYAPLDLGLNFSRARITGKWSKPLAELAPEVTRAAETVADASPDLAVFNCTATSMMEGPKGDDYLVGLVEKATGRPAISTASAVVAALRALGLRSVTLVTPYVQATNDHEKEYFAALGIDIVADVALGLKASDDYIQVSPQRWVDIALAADRSDAQACFMSCTNTSQIEAIEAIERATGKPAITANQAVLWACVDRLADKLDPRCAATIPGRLGRLLKARAS
jgi:maleate isomerase